MLEQTKVAFIGSGAMGGAMISGLLEQRLIAAANITASDTHAERCADVRARFKVHATTDNRDAIKGANIVVLSVKPQVLPQVQQELAGQLDANALVVSIIAGARLSGIAAGLGHGAVVRSMPNTPAQIGQGITVWTALPAVTAAQRGQTELLLGALGQTVFVDDEDYLDMATALSGTGPAYVFYFMEALIDAGVHMGFSRQIAEKLVVQTVKGSAEYVLSSPHHLARLRNEVTSPGGTSAEALYYLDKAGFRTAVSRAVWAAYQRSTELGSGRKRANPTGVPGEVGPDA